MRMLRIDIVGIFQLEVFFLVLFLPLYLLDLLLG